MSHHDFELSSTWQHLTGIWRGLHPNLAPLRMKDDVYPKGRWVCDDPFLVHELMSTTPAVVSISILKEGVEVYAMKYPVWEPKQIRPFIVTLGNVLVVSSSGKAVFSTKQVVSDIPTQPLRRAPP